MTGNWMSGHDDMNDLASRMAPPSWPLGRRGVGPWRERRGSGGSAMSATSEDDSSYDAAANDKSSQGSGGSAGLESVTHEIPIMIEAEMPPSMMQKQPQTGNSGSSQQSNDVTDHGRFNQQGSSSTPQTVAPAKRHSETQAPVMNPNEGNHGRGTRCASAPPQVVENSHLKADSSAPQMRSATVPIHNNVAKPFDPSYGTSGSVKQDPIMEETVQPPQPYGDQQPCNKGNQQPQHSQQYPAEQQHHSQQNYQQQQPQYQQQQPQYQQQQPQYQQQQPQYQQPQQPYHPNQYPQQQFYPQDQQYQQQPQYSNYPPHRQHRFFPQEFYHGRNPDVGFYQHPQQQPVYDEQYDKYPNYYPDAPVGFEDFDHEKQQPQRSSQHKTSGVIRNIPIFIEGQSDPIINEDRPASLSSSPRTQPMMRPTPPQRAGVPQERTFHPDPQHQRRSTEVPSRDQTPQPKKSQEVPIKVKHSGPQPQAFSSCQTPPRQASPAPPPVKLTPLQKIDQIRANNEEIMKRVDNFKGTKKDRDFLYLDEMLTRALISLDDIDPDGKDDVRQARKALIKDINSKISLLDKIVSETPKVSENEVVAEDKKASDQLTTTASKEEGDPGPKKEATPEESSGAPKEESTGPKPSNEEESKKSGSVEKQEQPSTATEKPIPLPEK